MTTDRIIKAGASDCQAGESGSRVGGGSHPVGGRESRWPWAGAEQAISILATYLSEVADGFEMDEFLRRLRTVRGPRPVRNRVRQAKELFLKRLAVRIKEQI